MRNNNINMNINNRLKENDFPIDSFIEDKMFFGNMEIKSRLKCGIPIVFIRDRGIWDCNLLFDNNEIPLAAVTSLLCEVQFKFEDLSFDSDEQLIKWLINQKEILDMLNSKHLKEVNNKWTILTNERLKNMLK